MEGLLNSKKSINRCGLWLLFAACACVTLGAGSSWAQLAPNQTQGVGNNQLITFTYLRNFDCVVQPAMDLDFNKKLAQSDPNEMQTPIHQPITDPAADPTGGDINHTAHF